MSRTRTHTVMLIVLAALALTVAAGVAPHAQGKAELAFKAATDKEVVDGDLRAAIAMYRKIAQGGDRGVAARALVRMGQCYEKLGDLQASEARKAYEQVVREFGDQAEVVAEARARLAAGRNWQRTLQLYKRGLPGGFPTAQYPALGFTGWQLRRCQPVG